MDQEKISVPKFESGTPILDLSRFEKHLRTPRTSEFKGQVLQDIYSAVIALRDSPVQFSSILVDQKSGHYVGIFVERLLSKLYGKHIPLDGFDLSRAHAKTNEGVVANTLHDKIKNDALGQKGPVLIVTEYINSGTSLTRALQILAKHGIDYKIVCMCTEKDFEKRIPESDVALFDEKFLFTSRNPMTAIAFGDTVNPPPLQSKDGSAFARPNPLAPRPPIEDRDTYGDIVALADGMHDLISGAAKQTN